MTGQVDNKTANSMVSTSLGELYAWAKGRIGQPLMLDYQLQNVNGQTLDFLFLLLREPGQPMATAEITIDFMAHRRPQYQARFSLLPLEGRSLPHPAYSKVELGSQQDIKQWVMTGRKPVQF